MHNAQFKVTLHAVQLRRLLRFAAHVPMGSIFRVALLRRVLRASLGLRVTL